MTEMNFHLYILLKALTLVEKIGKQQFAWKVNKR